MMTQTIQELMRQKELEICCGDIGSVHAAAEGGARRIELCGGLSEGGLTPSVALIKEAVRTGIQLVNVLIRPRPGDFLYSVSEARVMEDDVAAAIEAGAGGVVIGALTPDGDIDMRLCSRLVKRARTLSDSPVNITFHRAFDLARDAGGALDDIISLGCDCLLTSGMAATAEAGMAVLASLVVRSAGRVRIMAGGGVSPGNAARILAETGVGVIHATARSARASGMRFRREGVPMGAPGTDEYSLRTTDPAIVSRLADIVRQSGAIV